MGTFWELDRKPSPYLPLQKDKKLPLGAWLHHPIGSPLQKLRNIPWWYDGATQLALLTCFIVRLFWGPATRIGASHVKNCFLTNWLEGRERKLDGAAKKVGRLCVHVHAHSIGLPSFLPVDFKEQAGRTQSLRNRVRAPSLTLFRATSPFGPILCGI
jgi:hypothetical protein